MRLLPPLQIAALLAVCFFATNQQHRPTDLVVSAEFQTGETLAERTVAPGETVSLDIYTTEASGLTNLVDNGVIGTASFKIEDSVFYPGSGIPSGSVAFGGFLGTGEDRVLSYTGILQVPAVPEPAGGCWGWPAS